MKIFSGRGVIAWTLLDRSLSLSKDLIRSSTSKFLQTCRKLHPVQLQLHRRRQPQLPASKSHLTSIYQYETLSANQTCPTIPVLPASCTPTTSTQPPPRPHCLLLRYSRVIPKIRLHLLVLSMHRHRATSPGPSVLNLTAHLIPRRLQYCGMHCRQLIRISFRRIIIR